MNPVDTVPLMLLAVHMLALGIGAMVFVWIYYLHRRAQAFEQIAGQKSHKISPLIASTGHPASWLAVRSVEPEAVRTMLAGGGKFFISPRVNNWVIVTGPDLPNPDDDVDACHLFLTALSRELGHVQFFHAEKISGNHAWARLDEGCVTRAYAWAGETLWDQGSKTLAEKALRIKCFGYGESMDAELWMTREIAAANVDKIPLLAARWGIDPAVLRRTGASSSSQFY